MNSTSWLLFGAVCFIVAGFLIVSIYHDFHGRDKKLMQVSYIEAGTVIARWNLVEVPNVGETAEYTLPFSGTTCRIDNVRKETR